MSEPTFGQRYMIDPILPEVALYTQRKGTPYMDFETGEVIKNHEQNERVEHIVASAIVGKNGYFMTAEDFQKERPRGYRMRDMRPELASHNDTFLGRVRTKLRKG